MVCDSSILSFIFRLLLSPEHFFSSMTTPDAKAKPDKKVFPFRYFCNVYLLRYVNHTMCRVVRTLQMIGGFDVSTETGSTDYDTFVVFLPYLRVGNTYTRDELQTRLSESMESVSLQIKSKLSAIVLPETILVPVTDKCVLRVLVHKM